MNNFRWIDQTDPNDSEGRIGWAFVVDPAAKLMTLYKRKEGTFYVVCLGMTRALMTTDLDTAQREAIRWLSNLIASLSSFLEHHLTLIDQ